MRLGQACEFTSPFQTDFLISASTSPVSSAIQAEAQALLLAAKVAFLLASA
jgi:hypothetical protein